MVVALQLGALRDALIDAGATPDKAERVAEELATYENRFAGLDSRLVSIDGRLDRMDGRLDGMDGRLAGLASHIGVLTWAVGINVAVTLAVLARLLVGGGH
jgi:hypothetical protein